MRVDAAALALACLLFAGGAQAALYKWVDEQGRVQYSDKPPDQGKGAVQMTNRGIVVKKIEPTPTPEQKKVLQEDQARKQEEEAKAAEQRRQDQALLQSFTSVEEIDMKRDREVQALEVVIANLRGQERSLTERMADDRRRMEYYKKRGKPPPDSMQEDMERNAAQAKLIRDEIERRQAEIVATREKYEALKNRYRMLREQEKAARASAAPVTNAAPAPVRK